MELALNTTNSDFKNQGDTNQAAFAKGQRKNKWKSNSGKPQREQCFSI
jgi:hypothetical protein